MIAAQRDPRETERISAYTANDAMYFGDAAAHLTATSTPKAGEVRAVFNYARDITNKHAAATVAGVRSEIIPARRDDDSPALAEAQRILDMAHERSGGPRAILSANLSAIVRGDGAFYVGHANGDVFYTEIHPANVDVIERDATGAPAKVTAIVGDAIETWTRDAVTIDNGNTATTYANPYSLIPIVIWPAWPRPGSYWGDSLIEQIRACQRLLNERQNVWAWLMRMQGNPPIKSIGTKGAKLRSAPGEIWETEDAGVIIELVKLLDRETGDLHLTTIKLMLQTMRELANIPDIAYGIGNTQLSGVALKLAFAPMLQAAAVRRSLLAPALRYRDHALLTMHNILHGIQSPYVHTRIEFDGVLPTDEAQERQLNRYDVQVGTLSRASYMQRHGIDNPDNELDQIYRESLALTQASTPTEQTTQS